MSGPPTTLPPLTRSGKAGLAGSGLIILLTTAAVIARFAARHKTRVYLRADDWWILASLIVYYGQVSMGIWGIADGGVGIHVYLIPLDRYTTVLQSWFVAQWMFPTSITFTKFSILCLYNRIFGSIVWFRRALMVTGVFCVGWWVTVAAGNLNSCHPISKFWNIAQPGHCSDQKVASASYYGIGISNIGLDVIVVCLPIRMVWQLQLPRRQKWIVSGVFTLGAFVCIASIMRMVAIASLNLDDLTYSILASSVWAGVETGFAIVGACLPVCRPLIAGKLSVSRFTSSFGSKRRWYSQSSGNNLLSHTSGSSKLANRISAPSNFVHRPSDPIYDKHLEMFSSIDSRTYSNKTASIVSTAAMPLRSDLKEAELGAVQRSLSRQDSGLPAARERPVPPPKDIKPWFDSMERAVSPLSTSTSMSTNMPARSYDRPTPPPPPPPPAALHGGRPNTPLSGIKEQNQARSEWSAPKPRTSGFMDPFSDDEDEDDKSAERIAIGYRS